MKKLSLAIALLTISHWAQASGAPFTRFEPTESNVVFNGQIDGNGGPCALSIGKVHDPKPSNDASYYIRGNYYEGVSTPKFIATDTVRLSHAMMERDDNYYDEVFGAAFGPYRDIEVLAYLEPDSDEVKWFLFRYRDIGFLGKGSWHDVKCLVRKP